MASVGTTSALALSVVSAVSLILCNKLLLNQFTFATTLSSWHMCATFLWLHAARFLRFFDHKPCNLSTTVGFGVLNGAAIGLLNLSLGFNSVGFYQMAKLAVIPCTALIQRLVLGTPFSVQVQASLAVLLLGVGVATVTDVELNLLGALLSLLAIATTCAAQILTSTIQKVCHVSSTQLLYASSPYQALFLLLAGPPVDRLLTGRSLLAVSITLPLVGLIFLSCAVAVAVNFSNFLVIGRTSPVTFQVLGHLKTCLILCLGHILFGSAFSLRNAAGIGLALVGMAGYSYFKVQEAEPAASPVETPSGKQSV